MEWYPGIARAHHTGCRYRLRRSTVEPNLMWQPIETAPRDDTEILVWDGTRIRIVSYMHDDECGEPVWFPEGLPFVRASHWMPLPAPPISPTVSDDTKYFEHMGSMHATLADVLGFLEGNNFGVREPTAERIRAAIRRELTRAHKLFPGSSIIRDALGKDQ